jgi:hypothetical protein
VTNARRVRFEEPRPPSSSSVRCESIDRAVIRARGLRPSTRDARRGVVRSPVESAVRRGRSNARWCRLSSRSHVLVCEKHDVLELLNPLCTRPRLVIRFARAGSTANVRVASSTVRARSSERVACVGRERSRRVASRRRVASSSRVGRRTGRQIRRRRAASDSAAPPGNAVVRARAGVGGETRSGRRTVCTVVK